MRKLKAIDYTCGLSVATVGLGLYSYYVRELLVSFFLFGVAFSFVALAVLGAFLIWWVGRQMALWTRPFLLPRHWSPITPILSGSKEPTSL